MTGFTQLPDRESFFKSMLLSLFETLLRPGILLMQRLRMTAKFAIISAAFLVPLGWPSTAC